MIREVALRAQRGWTGVVFLAVAFGITMTAFVDLSLWQPTHPDITFWESLQSQTRVESLGVALYPLLVWAGGHAVFSITVPLAMTDALVPRQRGRPLLGRLGFCLILLASVGAGVLINQDRPEGQVVPSPAHVGGVLAVLAVLVIAAMSPLGRPVRTRPDRRVGAPSRTLVVTFLAAVSIDLLPWNWPGTLAIASLYVFMWGMGAPGKHVTVVDLSARDGISWRGTVGWLPDVVPGPRSAKRQQHCQVRTEHGFSWRGGGTRCIGLETFG